MLAEESYSRAALVTPGNRYNRRWEERGGTPSDNIRTVYNGVDPDLFPAAGPEPATPTLSWAGRVDPIKDLETLIRRSRWSAGVPDARLRMFGGTARGARGLPGRLHSPGRGARPRRLVVFEGGWRTSRTPTRPATW